MWRPDMPLLREILTRTWALSTAHMSIVRTISLGVLSLLALLLTSGLTGVKAQGAALGVSVLIVLAYWALLLAFNLVRAPFHLLRERDAALAAASGTGTALAPRQYLTMDPHALKEYAGRFTSVQAIPALSPYVGKWLRCSAELSDVADHGGKGDLFVLVWSRGEQTVQLGCYFDRERWGDRLRLLRIGDPLTLVGRFTGMGLSIRLDNCEVEEPLLSQAEETAGTTKTSASEATPKALPLDQPKALLSENVGQREPGPTLPPTK